jgi:hypothetical protein
MKILSLDKFREIWLCDFEFSVPPGERPTVICLVAHELNSGKKLKLWRNQFADLPLPPYPMDSDVLFVAYFASAEMACHLSLDWPMPINVLDLYTEFRNLTNGLSTSCGAGLLGALAYFGLDSIDAVEKESMRELAIRGGPWSASEKKDLLDYCETDVIALEKLLTRMAPMIDLPRAILRGRYMKATAQIEHTGIPIETQMLARLVREWTSIQESLIKRIDCDYGIYDGNRFKEKKFCHYLRQAEIPWPHLPSGRLDLKDDTFRDMARSYPEIGPLRELRTTLSQMRLSDLAVGEDGRNRCLLSPFRARTSRNQPSNSKFIFGPAVWLRSLIKPKPGDGLAYIDWSQQEFGIAAALSGDQLMKEAYISGDPYLAFAIQAGAAPEDATKHSHKEVRDQFKACVLAVQYGMGAKSLAQRIGQPVIRASELLSLHRKTYRRFWEWSEAVIDHAMLQGKIWTVFGWTLHTARDPNPRSIQNFPMQANGAEMLRLACCLLNENDITVCAPIHDAVLIEAPIDFLTEIISQAQEIMAQASEIVLDGFRLRTDVDVVRYPGRYRDERGTKLWDNIMEILEDLEE